jgi:DNA-binding LacI/PurR family transcriptional regulator
MASDDNCQENFFKDPMVSMVISGVASAAQSKGYTVLLSLYDNEISKFIAKNAVDGVIILGCHDNYQCKLNQAIKEGDPLVLFQDDTVNKTVSSIRAKNMQAIAKAVNYIIRLGHEKIAYVSGPLNITSGKERFEGFKETLKKANLKYRKEYVYIDDYYNEKAGKEFASKLTDYSDLPTAVCCANDRIAIGLIKGLKNLGFRVPEDISVIGYDNIELSKHIHPALTTVSIPYFTMAKRATKLLLNVINKQDVGKCIEFESKLCIRESCKDLKR